MLPGGERGSGSSGTGASRRTESTALRGRRSEAFVDAFAWFGPGGENSTTGSVVQDPVPDEMKGLRANRLLVGCYPRVTRNGMNLLMKPGCRLIESAVLVLTFAASSWSQTAPADPRWRAGKVLPPQRTGSPGTPVLPPQRTGSPGT